jgi:hypothetical protein
MMCPLPCSRRYGRTRLGNPQRAEQVCFQLRPDLGLADFLYHAELSVPGVVHDDVQPAEVVVRQLYRREVGVPVGNVQRDRQDPLSVFGRQVIQAGDVPGHRRDLVAAIQRRDRPLPAEATRRAGNEPGLHSHEIPFRL